MGNIKFSIRGGSNEVKITRRIELYFWRTCGLNTIGLILAWLALKPSIEFGNPLSFAVLVFVIWLLNWLLKPILVICTLPFLILTMGVGMLFINALVIYLAARLVPDVQVASYWDALLASLFVSILSWGVAMLESEKILRKIKKDSDSSKNNDNIIDL